MNNESQLAECNDINLGSVVAVDCRWADKVVGGNTVPTSFFNAKRAEFPELWGPLFDAITMTGDLDNEAAKHIFFNVPVDREPAGAGTSNFGNQGASLTEAPLTLDDGTVLAFQLPCAWDLTQTAAFSLDFAHPGGRTVSMNVDTCSLAINTCERLAAERQCTPLFIGDRVADANRRVTLNLGVRSCEDGTRDCQFDQQDFTALIDQVCVFPTKPAMCTELALCDDTSFVANADFTGGAADDMVTQCEKRGGSPSSFSGGSWVVRAVHLI